MKIKLILLLTLSLLIVNYCQGQDKVINISGGWYHFYEDRQNIKSVSSKNDYGAHHSLLIIEDNKEFGLLNNSLDTLIQPSYQDMLFLKTNSSFVAAKKNGKWGIIDQNNKVILNFEYDNIRDHYSGVILLRKNDKEAIFKDKEILVPFLYDKITYSQGDLVMVEKDGKAGLVNTKNKIIVEPEYDRITAFYGDDVAKVIKGDKAGYINKKGELLTQINYEDDREAMVKLGDQKHIFVNGELIPCKLALRTNFDYIYVRDSLGDKIYDTNGEAIFDSYFESINVLDKNLFAVLKDGKWGVLNKRGKVFVDFRYERIYYFVGDKTVCDTENGFEIINKKGKVLYTSNEYKSYDMNTRFIIVNDLDGKKGLMDWQGNVVLKPNFEEIEIEHSRSNTNYFFVIGLNSKWGVINIDGNYLIEPMKSGGWICNFNVVPCLSMD